MSVIQKLSYTNETTGNLRLIIEPWADQYVVSPGQKVDIVLDVADGCVEVIQSLRGIIIWINVGRVVSMTTNGLEIQPDAEQIRPDV